MFSNTLIADQSHLIDRKWRIHVLQMQETVQGRSVLYANTHVRTWEIRRIFLKVFSYKWKPFIVSWLNIVCANLFLSVDISLLLRTAFTLKIKKFDWWNVINLKHFSQYIAFSGKTKGNWGNSCTFVATKNRPWLIIISFKIYLESFSIQSHSFFLIFSLSINVEKF